MQKRSPIAPLYESEIYDYYGKNHTLFGITFSVQQLMRSLCDELLAVALLTGTAIVPTASTSAASYVRGMVPQTATSRLKSEVCTSKQQTVTLTWERIHLSVLSSEALYNVTSGRLAEAFANSF